MPKIKIFDIVPPSPDKEIKDEDLKIVSREQPAAGSSFWKKPLFLFACFLAGLIVLNYAFIQPRVEIEIWPETKLSEFTAQLTVDRNLKEPNFPEQIIPGEIREIEHIVSDKFLSTGIFYQEEKARGIIRVFNNYSTSPQSLITNTRFLSADGKLFRTQKAVTIPGGRYEGGKLVPGSIDIEVVADQPGPEYNIGPAVFSIPGFAGTPKYTAFYGKSSSPMEGGKRAEVHRVTQDDLDNAKKKLVEKATEESMGLFKKGLPSDFAMLDEAISVDMIETSPLAKAGQEVDSFIFQVKVKARNLVFRKSDLYGFASHYLTTQISSEKTFQESSLSLEYFSRAVDIDLNKITLDIGLKAKIYSKIDENLLKKEINSKDSFAIRQSITRLYPEVSKIKTDFWPFWVKKAPRNTDRIKIKLNLD